MNLSKKNKSRIEEDSLERKRSISYSMVFIAISFLIMSVLGIIFIVLMDLQPGWEFGELQGKRPIELNVINGTDSNGVFCYTDLQGHNVYQSNDPNPQWGGIYLLNPNTGAPKAQKTLDGPIKYASQIIDIDGDGHRDYLISKATVGEDWFQREEDDSNQYRIDIIEKGFTNKIVSGRNLTDIGEVDSFSPLWVFDVVSKDDLINDKPGLISLEKLNISGENYNDGYQIYLKSYYLNGTMVSNYTINPGGIATHYRDVYLPKIELINHKGTDQLLFANRTYFALFNISSIGSSDFIANPIYNYSSVDTDNTEFQNFEIIDDLDDDGMSEIILVNQTSNITAQIMLLNGSSGDIIHEFNTSFEFEIDRTQITEIHNKDDDGKTYIAFDSRGSTEVEGFYTRYINTTIYKITKTGKTQEFTRFISGSDIDIRSSITVLESDLNGDGVNEILTYSESSSGGQTMETYRINVFDFLNNRVKIALELPFYISELKALPDFDGDGNGDILIVQEDVIAAVSSREPVPIFISSAFPLGIPIFIVLIILLVLSILLLLVYGRKFKFSIKPIEENIRKAIKKKKITIGTLIISILLITMTFVMFLSLLNVMKTTLVAGTWMSDITIINLMVMILWYALLPLTAAIYNLFAPYFAYFFIRLRDLFFRISKAYNDKIIVLDMKDRRELGLVSKLKRIIVPLSLSLAVGFYLYNTIAPLLGYSTSFANVSGEELGRFMGGYMLLCILPLILSFLVFGFFNAGNYLLDDSGVVYLREPKSYRKPADVEPISYWTQSIIKGFAGLSAILTFLQFVLALDVSKAVDMEGLGAFFLVFLLIIIFYMLPFLTGFSFILLAEELMDFSTDYNRKRLYKLMDKKYDTNPREIKVPRSKSEKSEDN